MYVFVDGPTLKCSECGSTEVARTVRRFPTDSSWLVCLNCGHRGGEEKSPFATDTHGTNTYKFEPPKEIIF